MHVLLIRLFYVGYKTLSKRHETPLEHASARGPRDPGNQMESTLITRVVHVPCSMTTSSK